MRHRGISFSDVKIIEEIRMSRLSPCCFKCFHIFIMLHIDLCLEAITVLHCCRSDSSCFTLPCITKFGTFTIAIFFNVQTHWQSHQLSIPCFIYSDLHFLISVPTSVAFVFYFLSLALNYFVFNSHFLHCWFFQNTTWALTFKPLFCFHVCFHVRELWG